MIEKFNTSRKDITLDTDICIAGAGAAGITLARKLMTQNINIILLESGGSDYEQDTQDLYIGSNKGENYYDLRESRLRFFGGTTAIWGGRCAQLDVIDFEKRDWIAHSGWPISKETLRPYYTIGQHLLGLEPVTDNSMPNFEDPLIGKNINSAFWQFDEYFSRFTLPKCSDLKIARNVRVLLYANAINAKTSENGSRITELEIANLSGGRGIVRAKYYILALGGIENPRFMLASRSKAHPDGLGNQKDQVGRYFMEHPHARGAKINSSDPVKLLSVFPSYQRHNGTRYGLLFRPSEKTQVRDKVLNSAFTIGVYRNEGGESEFYNKIYNRMRHSIAPTGLGRGMWKVVKRLSRKIDEQYGMYLKNRQLKKSDNGMYAVIRAEQAPNPESRITLGKDKDAFGIARPVLDWKFVEADKRSVLKIMQNFDRDLKDLGLGTVEPAGWLTDPDIAWKPDKLVTNHDLGGYHHMGTTRMGDDPKSSVVESNCRVHGIDNLYIAGSSVFPTGGWANPTLTILALALRLGDHLIERNSAR